MRLAYIKGHIYTFYRLFDKVMWFQGDRKGELPRAVQFPCHILDRNGRLSLATASPDGIDLLEADSVDAFAGSSRTTIPLDTEQYVAGSVKDPWLVYDPERQGWHLLAAARDRSLPSELNACIAWWSEQPDGSWKSRPPLFSPGRFSLITRPELFEHEGIWFLLYTVTLEGETPFVLTDPHVPDGTLYASSQHGLSGTYLQPEDEIVCGGADSATRGLVRNLRTYLSPKGRMAFHPHAEHLGRARHDINSLLHPVCISPAGELALTWQDEHQDPGTALPLANQVLASFDGPSFHWLDADLVAGSMTVKFSLELGWQAGLIFHGDKASKDGTIVCLDARYACLSIIQAKTGAILNRRTWFPANDQQELRVIVPGDDSLEVYIDGKLMLYHVLDKPVGRSTGLYANRSRASFTSVFLHHLPQGTQA